MPRKRPAPAAILPAMRPPRVLLLSASAGSGHTRAAQAVAEALHALEPAAEVRHEDILDHTAKAYKKTYAGGFLQVVNRAPTLWGVLYHSSDRVRQRRLEQRFTRFFDKLEFAGFRDFVRELDPDVVVATHFLPCQVLAPYRERGRDRFPLVVVLTDFDVHGYWVQPMADRFFVGSGEVAAILAGRGIEQQRIEVSGIPIAAEFGATWDREAIRGRLGLSTDTPVVLVTAGGAGVGSFADTVSAVLGSGPVQVLAVCGRNEELRRRLAAASPPAGSSLHAFGFVSPIAELMAVADLAVAKSGGLTTAECLAMGLPMVVNQPIPGQEERNADYLLELGAGVKAHGLASLRFKLSGLLSDRARLRRMAEAARAAGRPAAAHSVAKAVLELARPRSV